MFPFSSLGPVDRTEKKALLFAVLLSALFLVVLSVSVPVKRTQKKRLTVLAVAPVGPADPFEPSDWSYGNPLDRFRRVPENFRGVDFKNFSYGIDVISNGKLVNLTLTAGRTWDDSGWYNLQDVYYTDITGDGSAEAIVRLLHLRCNVSCDGGADLFSIYTTRNGKLKKLWQYETGSFANGCRLKSLTLGNKQMELELFGRCSRFTTDHPTKFRAEDLTFMLFEFEGGRFVTKTIEYIPEPARNVTNYEPEIHIN